MPVSVRAADARLQTHMRETSTSRACKWRFRTIVAISLLQAVIPGAIGEAVDVEIFGPEVEGAYDFIADRICEGVTATAGILSESEKVEESLDAGTARSIAPLRTSNRTRTSPVRAETFFDRSMRAGAERSLLTSF